MNIKDRNTIATIAKIALKNKHNKFGKRLANVIRVYSEERTFKDYGDAWRTIEKEAVKTDDIKLAEAAMEWLIAHTSKFRKEDLGVALANAAEHGALKIMELLLKNKASANWDDAMQRAVKFDHIPAVALLLKYRAKINTNDNFNPLYVACQYNHYDMAKFLISKGAKVHSHVIDYTLLESGPNNAIHVKLLKLLMEHGLDKSEILGRVINDKKWKAYLDEVL